MRIASARRPPELRRAKSNLAPGKQRRSADEQRDRYRREQRPPDLVACRHLHVETALSEASFVAPIAQANPRVRRVISYRPWRRGFHRGLALAQSRPTQPERGGTAEDEIEADDHAKDRVAFPDGVGEKEHRADQHAEAGEQ